jgi:hypothetical protein
VNGPVSPRRDILRDWTGYFAQCTPVPDIRKRTGPFTECTLGECFALIYAHACMHTQLAIFSLT